jgi:hypothetical protein
MPLTSPDHLRIYLTDAGIGATPVNNYAMAIPESGAAQLPHGQLVSGSVKVKADMGAPPMRYTQVITDSWTSLPATDVIEDTLVVASDQSLGDVYREGADYEADYAAGRLRRLPDGAIGEAAVSVWCRTYRVFSEGIDFTVEHSSGRVRRIAGGEINPGQAVFVDYTPSSTPASDALLEEAIREADRRIASAVVEEYSESSDPALAAAATYVALALVAHAMSGAALAAPTTTSSARAEAWRAWGERWQGLADRLLEPFLRPAATMQKLRLTGRTS